jgi:chorismate mutase
VKFGSYRPWRALGILFLVGLSGCYRPSVSVPDQAVLDRLLQFMQQRLLLMHDVARWKWNQKQAIADPKREQAFLENMQAKGQAQGLDEEFVRSFFRAQIEAAKQVQEDDFQRWQAEGRGSFADVPDLSTHQRPKIDAASNELLSALAAAQPFLRNAEARRQLAARAAVVLTGDGITSRVCRTALQPLETPRR